MVKYFESEDFFFDVLGLYLKPGMEPTETERSVRKTFLS